MSTPTFGGNQIFGYAPVISTRDVPRETQTNAFFGLDGVEQLDGGDRGMESHATGILLGLGESGLRSLLTTFRSFKDGQGRVLTDTIGIEWPNVTLKTFTPSPMVHSTPQGYRWCRYEAIFFHSTSS